MPGFDHAFFDKRLEAVVGFTQADVQVPGEFALGDLGVFFEVAQELGGFPVQSFIFKSKPVSSLFLLIVLLFV